METTTAHTRLWHPFAAMGKVDGHELVLMRGEGCRLWDADDHEYLDATAGLWFVNVGHGRAEIAEAVMRKELQSRGFRLDDARPSISVRLVPTRSADRGSAPR